MVAPEGSQLMAQWGFSGPGCTKGGAADLTEGLTYSISVCLFLSESRLLPLRQGSLHLAVVPQGSWNGYLNHDDKKVCLRFLLV